MPNSEGRVFLQVPLTLGLHSIAPYFPLPVGSELDPLSVNHANLGYPSVYFAFVVSWLMPDSLFLQRESSF